MDVSVIVVNYNTRDLLLQTLRSVKDASQSVSVEVFVVDNGSDDGSPEAVAVQFPEVHLIVNQYNVGFAAANNQAIQQARGRYYLLLNSDTVVRNDTLKIMVDFMDGSSSVGASGCKVVLADGCLDLACRRSFPTVLSSLYHVLKLDKLFPNSKRFAAYNLTYLNPDASYPVDCLVGAFMMVRSRVVDEVGLLDERFFMYGEDIDWCYRIRQHGWDIWYVPATSITHYKGASGKKSMKVLYHFYWSLYLYAHKHRFPNMSVFVRNVIKIGIFVILAMAVIKFGAKRLIDYAYDLLGVSKHSQIKEAGGTTDTVQGPPL